MAESYINYAPDDNGATECYVRAIRLLSSAKVDFLVGGAYAFARYAGIPRHTKDFDIFVRESDRDRTLDVLGSDGFRTEVTADHWLAKALHSDYFIDIISSSGNGVATVDDLWFEHAVEDEVLGERVRLCPPEETIWSKSFVMERQRYDGADVAHIFRAIGERLDWKRLLNRFGDRWRVLYSHLILFEFIYPSERNRIPSWVLETLTRRALEERNAPPWQERICNGTLLSAVQYLPDTERWGYRDGRISPDGPMTQTDATAWSNGILAQT